MRRFALFTDLDRTLIANGKHPENPHAKQLFKLLTNCAEVTLIYVSGRNQTLVQQAIHDFDLPQPDYVIADVGSSIYQLHAENWLLDQGWQQHLSQSWSIDTSIKIKKLLQVFAPLKIQEPSKQGEYKVSYYVSLDYDCMALSEEISRCLSFATLQANLVWSVDLSGIGLLDILPSTAGKLQAVRYLISQQIPHDHISVFAGDSGNDLDVLLSDLPSVLVANADEHIHNRVIQANNQHVYIAQGNYLGMNGCYAAGILEGLAHHVPDVGHWLQHHIPADGE